jgi:hypothetical protein
MPQSTLKPNILNPIIDANIESLEQGEKLIQSLSTEQYRYKATPLLRSSIGEHFRHITDIYFALIQGFEHGIVDFNLRRRGALGERNREMALGELTQIKTWLRNLNSECNLLIQIKTEVALSKTQAVEFKSSLARELIFCSSHATHHYAVMGIIAKLQDINVEDGFGLAASTATYERGTQQLLGQRCVST